MPGGQRNTPITDFLFRLEVDPSFVVKLLDEPEGAFGEYDLPDEAVKAITDRNWPDLQELVDAEHPDRVHIIPRGWVR
jgi:hypothetical protein